MNVTSRFDVAGFVTSSLGLGLLMYGVSEGPNAGWAAAKIFSPSVVSAA